MAMGFQVSTRFFTLFKALFIVVNRIIIVDR